MPLLYEKKHDSRGGPYIEITGYEGEQPYLCIPEKIDGIEVRSIGSRAFAGRSDLRRVELPKNIDTMRQYAFYDCRNLEQMILHDGVEDYYDGVIKQCRALCQIEVFLHRGHYAVVRDMLADNDRRMKFVLHFCEDMQDLNQERLVSLIFPAYVYDFVEDVEARVLHHKIEGSGYSYRECVTRGGIDYRAYDRLFQSAVDDDAAGAAELALIRLMFPYELSAQAKEQYEAYVKANAYEVLRMLIEGEQGEEGIRFLAGRTLIPEEALRAALKLTARPQKAIYGAILMDYQHDNFRDSGQGQPEEGIFSLEDW